MIHRFRLAWKKLLDPQRQVFLYAAVGGALVMAFALLPGGFDYWGYFHRMATGCYSCTYNPYFLEWFLRPLGVFENWRTGYVVWIAISIALLWWATRRMGGRPFAMLLAPTTLWIFWLGQIDTVAVVGLTLAWWSLRRGPPWVVGIGLLMMATKPQLMGAAILLFVLWAGWRALLIPAGGALLSFALYGLDWPLRWMEYTPQTMFDGDAWFYISTLWLLPGLAGLLLVRGRLERLQYALAATMIGVPYIGVYSFFALMVFPLRWWEIALAYIPFIAIGLTGDQWWLGLMLAQPISVMARLLYESRMQADVPVVEMPPRLVESYEDSAG